MKLIIRALILVAAVAGLSSCGRIGLGNKNADAATGQTAAASPSASSAAYSSENEKLRDSGGETESIWKFLDRPEPELVMSVNRYLWNASVDVLNFLPVESVDPFSGIIVTGYGTPPGGGRAYRATVHIKDPALDARSLNVSLQTKGGPASAETIRAVENAILARARQLRIADKNL